MKRDWDLIRTILLYLEENGHPKQTAKLEFDDYGEETIMYNARLLLNNGYIEGSDDSGIHDIMIDARCLTMKGHDFLDDARNETVWQTAKRDVVKYGPTASLAVMQGLLVLAAKKAFGLS